MHENNYEEISRHVIRKYIESKKGTSQLGARKLRCEEFAEYVKGERQKNMFEEKENAVAVETENVSENEVAADAGAISESEAVKKPETNSDMCIANENEPESTNESVHVASDVAVKTEPVVTMPALKKRGRKAKAENENRTQISAYLSNEVYAGIKALSVTTQQPISDIVSQVMNAFYEDNLEVIKDSIRTVQLSESINSRIKYHR